ncbi:TFIIH subunit TTDA/Tfb5 [Tribonema minus]|uniref:General transcription and DNA repair factor IIH subunit TFB5 n=1 Tax=Tribonema minus TaxID=303371 RepID=A0A835ZC95_9STRA|nr:TFIIH subunit TTDA/Tfb5 [Tribonema minus]
MSNVRTSRKGVLITCDVPTKQFILHLNSKQAQGFIINDLDETHLFVEASAVHEIREQLERLQEMNVYVRQA